MRFYKAFYESEIFSNPCVLINPMFMMGYAYAYNLVLIFVTFRTLDFYSKLPP